MGGIGEIARMVGVSESTVSRILSNDTTFAVSKQTREAVQQAAEKLNYRPRRTNSPNGQVTIYLIHKQAGKERVGDTFYIELKSQLESLGHDRGFRMANLYHINQIKRRSIPRADGLIAIGKYDNAEIAKLKSLSNCIVFLDFDIEGYDTINLESESAVKEILTHLINRHHKKIAFIGARDEGPEAYELENREKAVYKVLRQKRLLKEEYIRIGKFDTCSGYTLCKELMALTDRPTAIFVVDDKLAIGAYRAIKECGLNIPRDVSVIGYSDMPVSRYLIPSLTTYHVEFDKLASKALQLIQEQMEGRIVAKQDYVSGKIIERESVWTVSP
jgi:Transcriptional regulators